MYIHASRYLSSSENHIKGVVCFSRRESATQFTLTRSFQESQKKEQTTIQQSFYSPLDEFMTSLQVGACVCVLLCNLLNASTTANAIWRWGHSSHPIRQTGEVGNRTRDPWFTRQVVYQLHVQGLLFLHVRHARIQKNPSVFSHQRISQRALRTSRRTSLEKQWDPRGPIAS